MAYTQNESIDGLTAITPTTDDIVVTMDQAEIGVAKTSTLLSIYNLFKTTYDTVYAKYLGDADFYQYSIVRTVASGNLTVALKNYEGNDPTPTKPVKIQIGDVVRSITSALSLAQNAGLNWSNLGSSELATKEADQFCYLGYSTLTSAVHFGYSRIPNATVAGDFSGSATNEKWCDIGYTLGTYFASTDPVVNIGRFNATLSAGAGYTWSIPATSVIINSPIYETRWLNYQPIYSGTGSMTMTSVTTTYSYYKILGNILYIRYSFYGTIGGVADSGIKVTLPISTSYLQDSQLVGLWNLGRQTGDIVTYNSFFEIRRYPTNYTLGTDNGFNGNIFLSI